MVPAKKGERLGAHLPWKKVVPGTAPTVKGPRKEKEKERFSLDMVHQGFKGKHMAESLGRRERWAAVRNS